MEFSVEKVASLAYLKLSDDEKAKFEAHFEKIMNYVDQVKEVPMTAEEAKSMGAFHVQASFYKELDLNYRDVLRADETNEDTEKLRLDNAEALKNAPQKTGLPNELLFEVPSIIDRN